MCLYMLLFYRDLKMYTSHNLTLIKKINIYLAYLQLKGQKIKYDML